MQPIALEKIVLIQGSILHIKTFWQFRVIKHSLKGWKKNWKKSSYTKTQLLIEILTEEILTAALRKMEFEYQEK